MSTKVIIKASVNSSCMHPPPRATAGHLPTLSVLGVGHEQTLYGPFAGLGAAETDWCISHWPSLHQNKSPLIMHGSILLVTPPPPPRQPPGISPALWARRS